jgi:hypothetical protein
VKDGRQLFAARGWLLAALRITSPPTASAGSGSISASRFLTKFLALSFEARTASQLSNMLMDVTMLPPLRAGTVDEVVIPETRVLLEHPDEFLLDPTLDFFD